MCVEILRYAFGTPVHGAKTMHGPFGLSSAPGRVNDGRHLVRGAFRQLGQRFVPGDDVVPLFDIILRGKGKGDHGQIRGHSLFHFIPDRIELAHKKKFRL